MKIDMNRISSRPASHPSKGSSRSKGMWPPALLETLEGRVLLAEAGSVSQLFFTPASISAPASLNYVNAAAPGDTLTVSATPPSSSQPSGTLTFNDPINAIVLDRTLISLRWTGNGTNTATGPAPSASMNLNLAANDVSLQSTEFPTTINPNAGATRTISLGNTSTGVQNLAANVSINSSGVPFILDVSDSGDTTGRSATLSRRPPAPARSITWVPRRSPTRLRN